MMSDMEPGSGTMQIGNLSTSGSRTRVVLGLAQTYTSTVQRERYLQLWEIAIEVGEGGDE